MRLVFLAVLMGCLLPVVSCSKSTGSGDAVRTVRKITYNGVSVDVVIDKPQQDTVDVLVVYHGTVSYDSKILEAAHRTLDEFKRILTRTDMMIVSVAYPEENLMIGDNIAHAEAALLWVKNNVGQELGVTIRKIFLGGHSQGGYIVTRLNTMHATHGVIANAPGPLNLVYRCQLEESGMIVNSIGCGILNSNYGSPTTNPSPYFQRSLLNFTTGFKSDILFIQGMDDGAVQLYSWPVFRQNVTACSDCRERQFLEIPNFGHTSLFESSIGKTEFNRFIQNH
ncbi:MAG: alpha/beta hydrolase family protein [Bacteroidota bacterium]